MNINSDQSKNTILFLLVIQLQIAREKYIIINQMTPATGQLSEVDIVQSEIDILEANILSICKELQLPSEDYLA